ncbi:MAG: flagellar biosynthesis protein FlhF [Methylobacter sp.]|uniref:flagellar biosynthesis protein FlhF n=1 Tax=Methylobacter sp. TaxID=2051955 RepID=UPI00272F47E1|nr:flagellar biosynthesis protein FlhF [Methylobacter sp.]MDP1665489.1 flagellar biosynthesis protein FlhF [Methylobacter sp.]MDP1970237.1 flagellar biosynthesis protein FlhF [Methylobacter sp.]
MKIKRFFAPDIRQAMRMVKEELGADAVIMSNRSVDGGVEIVAARDFDEQLIQSKLQKQAAEQQASERSQRFPADSETSGNRETRKMDLPDFEAEKNRLHVLSSQRKQSADGFLPERSPVRPQQRFSTDRDTSAIPGSRRNIDQYVGYAEKVHLRGNMETVTAKVAKPVAPAVTQRPKPVERPMQIAIPAEKQSSPSDNLLMEMSKELKSLRSAMDSKLSSVSWGAMSQTNPVRADLLQRLAGMSISRKLSVKIANRFTNHTDPELVFAQAQELLAKVLPVAEDDLLQHGGIVALVGPTGVGKTTTIAKLAAKFILKHGPRQVALITTDNYRIGAHEQLNTYGRILDVPVRVASSAAELRNLINGFSDKRLILIDTAGMSQRDMKLVEQINTLQQSGIDIKSYLVMSAATEYKAMNEIIKAFQVFEPQASILTKLDEAATIGSAVSSIIENNLPLSFIADGQQVPEDMHSPCARTLIAQCVAELDQESDYNDVNNEAWAAQGYA